MGRSALENAVDAVLDRALAIGRIVGAVILVCHHGTPVYSRAQGFADREAGVPIEVDTVFRLASLTKPLVAATALALVERGRLSLDDAVTTYLPGFRPRLADGREPVITLHHLLTHTAGFGYPEAPASPADTDDERQVDPSWQANVSNGLDQPGLSLSENLRRIASVPLSFAPGAGWRYGVATDVLGAVIEAQYGAPLADAVAEFVTGPLAMVDTAFHVREPSRLAVPYADGTPRAERMSDPQTIQGIRFSPSRAFDDTSFQSGGAGMVGTAGDFMQFLEAIRAGGAPILTAGTVAASSTNLVGALRDYDEPGWGFGLLCAVCVDPVTASTPQAIGTLSWGGVYGHHWFIDPSLGLSCLICTNTALEGCTGQFRSDVRDAVYAALHGTP